MRKSIIISILCALALGFTSCKYEKKAPSSALVLCDQSFENVMEQLIDVYEYIYPNNHILCRYGTQREAIDSLLAVEYPTIVIPRALTESEKAAIKNKHRNAREMRIAVDAVALIVNPDNPIDAVSVKEISDILSGEVKTWYDLDPNYPDKQIAVLFDDANSSMTAYMRDSLLSTDKFGDNVHAQGSIKGVIDAVKKDKNAIGVIGVSWLTSDLKSTADIDSIASDVKENRAPDLNEINDRISSSGVKVLGVMKDTRKPYKPFQTEIYMGDYPLTRSIWMITISPAGSPGGNFYAYCTGWEGQNVIVKTGVMPARFEKMKRVELTK